MAAPVENENSQDERFDLSTFLETWVEILPESYFLTNINKDLERRIMKTEMDISDEMLNELEAVCSVDTLKQIDEEKEEDPLMNECMMFHVIPESSVNKLITLRTHKQYLLAQEAFPHMKKTFLPKMVNLNMQKLLRQKGKSEPASSTEPDEMECEIVDADIIVTVQVFQPMLYHRGKCSAFVDSEYLVRGTTLLSEFRDALTCVRDSVISADLSNDPDPSKYPKAKDVYKSGFLYIDHVFYNDMRDASAIDYSKKILEWGAQGVAELQNAKSVEMEALRFMDLKLKLNEVYLYQHQGDCEHVFTFTDIRLVHEDDPPNRPHLYPRLTRNKHQKRQLCRTCWKLQAKWLVNDDPYSIDDPTYLCDTCFKCLHYDETGQRTKGSGPFRAFYFMDRTHVDAGSLVMADHSTE